METRFSERRVRRQRSGIVLGWLLVAIAIFSPWPSAKGAVTFQEISALPQSSRPEEAESGSAEALFQKGLSAYRNRNFLESLSAARKAVRLAPNEARYQHLLGVSLFGLGQLTDARKAFEDAVTLDPKAANFKYDLAVLYMRVGETDKARGLLEEVIHMGTELPMAYLFLGRIYHNDKRVEEGLQAFQEAEKLNPTLMGLHYHMGIARSALGDDITAIREMEQETRLHPNFIQARLELGDLYLRVGQAEAALEHLQHALKMEPKLPRANFLLGKALYKLGRDEEALAYLETAAQADVSMSEPHYLMVQIYMRQGKTELAQEQLRLFEQKKEVRVAR